MRIKVTCDSTCDLSSELVEKYGIHVIPMHIIRGEETLLDGVNVVPEDIYEYVKSGKGVCHTAATNMAEYIEVFREILKNYDAVIHINISSGFSACYDNSCMAAKELKNVYPVDSLNLSTGSGHLAIDAAIMANQGMAQEEIRNRLNEEAKKLEVSFILDTLYYMRKGGRCSAVASLGANLLHLKPCIEVKEGKMVVGKKYRGSLEKVLVQYVRDRLQNRDDIDTRRIFVTTTGVPEDTLKKVHETVDEYFKFDEVLDTRAGCAVANHCGPQTLGILFFRK